MSTKAVAAPDGTATTKLAKACQQSTSNRRRAARRLPPLGCGCADPWVCRCDTTAASPSDNSVNAYLAALLHLKLHGLPGAPFLPEMRAAWGRGEGERRIISEVTSRWVVAP